MGKQKQLRGAAPSTIEVRNVRFDDESDGKIDTWRAEQKRKGRRLKRHEAVEELTKRGLKAEGIV
jgi:hypothetical protein